MRSYGGLFEQIVDLDNLRESLSLAAKGKHDRTEVIAFKEHAEKNIVKLQDELIHGHYLPGAYFQFKIWDPKPRIISCAPFRDRVVHHALCRVITPLLEKHFIYDTWACRRGKGSHMATRRARLFCGRYRYWLKCDISKFFESIDQGILLIHLKRQFRESRLRELLGKIILGYHSSQGVGRGLPIGNLTSQWFANEYMDKLDHFVCEELNSSAYLRYMDDFILFSNEKSELWAHLERVRDFLLVERHLQLKERVTRVGLSADGLPFLGLNIFPHAWRLKRERFVRSREKVKSRKKEFDKGLISEAQLQQCLRSSQGVLDWYGFNGILANISDP